MAPSGFIPYGGGAGVELKLKKGPISIKIFLLGSSKQILGTRLLFVFSLCPTVGCAL